MASTTSEGYLATGQEQQTTGCMPATGRAEDRSAVVVDSGFVSKSPQKEPLSADLMSQEKLRVEERSAFDSSVFVSSKAPLSANLTFVAHSNPVTGKMDWVVRDDNYDYLQEIARSGYGDMLHDKDRNEKYYLAIKQAIKFLKEQNKKVKSFDIGTGTGLLSMMAATAGADSVTACEAFLPIATCAEKVLEANGFKNKIKLISKRSTEVSLGDIGERANLLVTELFDTELIGEGAIESYTDAHSRLMEEDCVAVPTTGIMYVQAVQCDLLRKWNSLQPVMLPNGTVISAPDSFIHCTGAVNLHDLQVDQLEEHLQFISPPVEVFRFDFSRRNGLLKEEHSRRTVCALHNGHVDAFVMWWDLIMDPQGEIVLSCGPAWTREKGEPVPWRDHWMQALYYPSSSTAVQEGQSFDIYGYHDEYSLCFNTSEIGSLRSACVCGLHVALSRSRLGQVNDHSRNDIFIQALERNITDSTVVLVVSDSSLLPLFAACLGARKVFYLDTNWSCRKVLKKLIAHNKLQDRITVLEKNAEDITEEDLEHLKIDLIIAEPFFQAALLPWEHLYFWYAINSLKQHLSDVCVILPKEMTIKAMAVELRDLHKIRTPVGNCEGFDITEFDNLIEMASLSADEDIEPQPLWEYPSVALSPPAPLVSISFSHSVESVNKIQQAVHLTCHKKGSLNGVVFWTEFSFGNDLMISTGLANDNWEGQNIKWDMFSKQGVKLFRRSCPVVVGSRLRIETQFMPQNGDFSFLVDISGDECVVE
ncbi:hypothetical protein BsWGS_22346 [Bradybaena similaris]